MDKERRVSETVFGSSPPTDRVVRVLDAIAAARTPMTAAEIGRAASITAATAHSLLASLVSAGYLLRDAATRTYRLGPAILTLGAAAAGSFPEIAAARPALQRLHSLTRLPVIAATAVGAEIVIVEHIGPPTQLRGGQRLDFAPPFGAVHLMHSPARDVEAWLRRAKQDDPALAETYRDVLAGVRELGFAASPYDAAAAGVHAALGDIARDALSAELRERLDELVVSLQVHDYQPADLKGNGKRELSLNTLSAPVVSADGRVAFVVSLAVHAPAITLSEIRELAASLTSATTAMGAELSTDARGAQR